MGSGAGSTGSSGASTSSSGALAGSSGSTGSRLVSVPPLQPAPCAGSTGSIRASSISTSHTFSNSSCTSIRAPALLLSTDSVWHVKHLYSHYGVKDTAPFYVRDNHDDGSNKYVTQYASCGH